MMRMHPVTGTVVAFLAAGCSSAMARKEPAGPTHDRTSHFEYAATVTGLPAQAKSVRIWIPLPRTDETQTISNLLVESPVPHRETREALYGNRIAYFEIAGPCPEQVPIKISFDVHRFEVTAMNLQTGGPANARFLEGDRLAPLGGEVTARASQATRGKGTVMEKARGIYDRVLSDLAYDKTGQGWGRGDIRYVCEAGKGNCSDFHALFISMARAERLPALFEIGFPLPLDKTEGVVGGYHCWAWFQEKEGVWRPVDASEADKDPSRKDYYFGTLCCNRVALSRGRDLVLEPAQAGEPLNFFIYPYVEVDGKPVEVGVERRFAFRDLGAEPAGAD